MFASWRKPSGGWRNDWRTDQPSLAIDVVCGCGGASDGCLPREQGPGTPLAVVQRFAEIPAAVCCPDEPWEPSGADSVATEDCSASRIARLVGRRARIHRALLRRLIVRARCDTHRRLGFVRALC